MIFYSLNFFGVFIKNSLINMVAVLMISANLATLGLLKKGI